jgi:methyl-accepting chemotaxis protein
VSSYQTYDEVFTVKQWLAQFSIQKKILTLLAVGFTGFFIYFTANYFISRDNQRLMNTLVEEHLPMLEVSESLNLHLTQVKNALAQNAYAVNMDNIANLESANARVSATFADLKKRGAGKIPDLDEKASRYFQTYKGVSETLQNVLAGVEQPSSAQKKYQGFAAELSALEKWSIDLKERQTSELRDSLDIANTASTRTKFAGWVLLLGGFPFGMFFMIILRDAIERLQLMSSRLTDVAQNVLKISTDASSSSARLASASGQQASAVTESVSSMEEMKVMLAHTVHHSSEALRSSEESFREAADGKEVVDDLRSAMRDIEHAYSQLEEVNQIVSSIRSKTNIINDIVFKTQLLSFNASIEAARAGQHGRGFSVVAAEVGKLAEMSGVAAQEIGKLLDHSSNKVSDIVQSTKVKVGAANKMSEKCATVFERITHRTGEAKSMVDAITSAASEQESGIQQVSTAMAEMKDSADQNDRMAHDISGLSDSLREQSQTLAATVDRLENLVHGSRNGKRRNDGPRPGASDSMSAELTPIPNFLRRKPNTRSKSA